MALVRRSLGVVHEGTCTGDGWARIGARRGCVFRLENRIKARTDDDEHNYDDDYDDDYDDRSTTAAYNRASAERRPATAATVQLQSELLRLRAECVRRGLRRRLRRRSGLYRPGARHWR